MMASTTFTIPQEFASQLREVKPKDNRSDDEIIKSLSQQVPVTTEKNIWAYWDKGIERMPGWCQRNVIAWVRMCGNGDKPWTVRVLDAIPDSPNYALKFVPGNMMPQSFVDGKMQGPYIGQHSADFLRGALLYQHGGAFMDVGNILFRHLDRVCWDELEDPASPYQIAVPLMYSNVIANHFVMARKGDVFIKKWYNHVPLMKREGKQLIFNRHELFTYFWRDGRTIHTGISQDPVFEFARTLDFSGSQAANFHWDFKISAVEVFEYISQIVAWIRLTMLEEAGENFSGSEYWQKHVLLFDALQEDWGAEATIGFNGSDLHHALKTRLDADPESEAYKKAYQVVWRLLTRSAMQKITHGKHLTNDKHLGTWWDENEGDDIAPGTFAELLRYGELHFEQTRKDIVKREAKKADQTMKKGLLEP